MREQQIATFLQGHPGFFRGVISSHKPNEQKTLSEVLESGHIPTRYFLSPKACAGILRRAEKRGKELPEALRIALEAVASGQTSPQGGAATSSMFTSEGSTCR